MHNAGLGTAASSLYIYPGGTARPEATGYGVTAHRLARVDVSPNETFFFEPNYPLVLTDRDFVVVEILQPGNEVGGTGIGTIINYQLLGDTDI
jgi:hypothetical protein